MDPIFSGGYADMAITDASGWYDISLPNDDYFLRASASGYTAGFAYVFFWSSQTVAINVTLWPIVSTIAGHLIDGDVVLARFVRGPSDQHMERGSRRAALASGEWSGRNPG